MLSPRLSLSLSLLVLLLFAGENAHCQQSWADARNTNKGILEVHVAHEPPFCYFVKDSLVGIEPDILQGFKRYVQAVYGMELELKIVKYEKFGNSLEALKRSENGAVSIGAISLLPERKQLFGYSLTYMPDVEMLITTRDVPLLDDSTDLHELEGVKALSEPRTSMYQNFEVVKKRFLPRLVIDTSYNSTTETLAALQKRERAMAYITLPHYLLHLTDMTNIRRQRVFTAVREGVVFLFPKESDWIGPFNDYLVQLQATGGLREILVKHLGKETDNILEEMATAKSSSKREMLLNYREEDVLNSNLEEQRAKGEKYERYIWLLVVGISLGSLLGLVLIRQNRYRRRTNKLLTTQHDELSQAYEELKQTQENLIRAEKEAALAKLVTNLAHQLNSPLGAMRSSASLLEEQLPKLFSGIAKATSSIPEEHRDLFFLFLSSQLPAIALVGDRSTREHRQVKQMIISYLADWPENEAETLADAWLLLGITNISQVPEPLTFRPYLPIWKVVADLARALHGTRNMVVAADKARRVVALLRLYIDENLVPPLVPTPIRPVLDKILYDYRGSLTAGIELVTDFTGEPSIWLDPERLEVLLTQPIINSIQAVKGSGTIKLNLTVMEEAAVFTVTDNGPGIPKEIQDKVFEPFVTTKAGGEGSGLGLYLARRLAESIGGSARIDSTPQETVFQLSLPVA